MKIMMDYAFRLTKGMDIIPSIEEYCKDKNIQSACIVSCVGCVYKATLRLADGVTVKEFDNNYEILSLVGTTCPDGTHLHISLSDNSGTCIGGHLMKGTYVNTTAEIVIRSLDERYVFTREYDESTGYDELVIKDK